MAHFGLVCPPGTSHVTGLTTVARELCGRGHRATVFNILDVEALAEREGVGFRPLGVQDHPKGAFKASSQTRNKYLNGEWKRARVNVGFYAKGADKAQIAVQVNKLASKEEVERERATWKAALAKLQAALER